MKYLDLRTKIKSDVFSLLDIAKAFPEEKEETVKIQLSRLMKKSLLTKIKRGLYCFDVSKIDEFSLANILYQPSYISLETALNYYGLIPDIPLNVSSITLTTTKHLKNAFGNFDYYKIKPSLFFGFTSIQNPNKNIFNLAEKEKALLDYFYLRKITSVSDLRLNIKSLDLRKYKRYRQNFPGWVQKIALS